jgi:single-stranded-DNA-specific exonuclease
MVITSTSARRWTIAPPHPQAGLLASQLKVSPLVAQVLLNRGIETADDGQKFLKPNLKLLHEPSLIPGLELASERIAKAVRDREKIVIYASAGRGVWAER